MVKPVLPRDQDISNPGNKALGLLALLAAAPLIVNVPANFNIVLIASLCVFAASWKSVKPEPPADSMSHNVRPMSR